MKIFGIGLSKTGTTSLASALEILGYRTKDYPGVPRYVPGDLTTLESGVLDAYDAFTDTPIPSLYKALDAKYPESKFILTVRDKDGWLKSCKKQFTQKLADIQTEAHNRLFTDLYDCTVFDENKFLSGYERFVDGVLQHFKDRPHDLLVINVAAGEGWEKLCPFLGQPVPEMPFPKANVTQISWMNVDDIVAIARQAGQSILAAYRRRQAGGAVARALNTLGGGDSGALQRAWNKAHALIVDGLRQLSPQIPVLSRKLSAVPYAERAKWNHLWLVDPLDGEAAFLGAEAQFTVNIALIQDGTPLYGIVYAPLTDTVYYAGPGKGAFKTERGEAARRLEAVAFTPHPALTPEHGAHMPLSASRALTMCLVAEGRLESCSWADPTPEWQTAAAHLIAGLVGKRVYDCKSNQSLKYNKEHLVSECVTVESAPSVAR
jgi:3'-phosphoadenosine 5'-phosphosulfate (PAPS) 3'-phosphatase